MKYWCLLIICECIDLRYCCIVAVTGSCHPFMRSALQHDHVYKTSMAGVKREFLCCACILTIFVNICLASDSDEPWRHQKIFFDEVEWH